MGSLRDEMLKKGLVDKKRDRKLRHGEAARRKEVGAEAVAREEREREEARRREEEAKRQADRRREEERRRLEAERQAESRVHNLIREGLVPRGPVENRRFYFITREQTVSFIEVSPAAMRRLVAGRYAIVEAGDVVRGDFCVVTGDTARALYELEPERVRFWNGTGKVRDRKIGSK